MPTHRVLHIVRRFSPLIGGTERYVLELARAQRAAGHVVNIVTLDRDVLERRSSLLPRSEEIEGVTVIRLPGYGQRRWAGTVRPDRVAALIGWSEVVHVHDFRFLFGLAVILARVRRRPVIVHTHGLIFHTSWAAGLKRVLVRLYFGPLLRLGRAAIIADSEPDRDLLLGLVPYLRPQTRWLPDAIDLRPFDRVGRTPVPGRVLTHGRVAPSKGIDRLIGALCVMDRDDWTLRVVGPAEGNEPLRLLEIAATFGKSSHLEFTGAFAEGGQLEELSAAQIAAYPSLGEGFGLALLEAMAAGVPVVASDIAAHRSLLGDGLADRLVDFGDPASAAMTLSQLLDSPSAALAEIGDRERARSLGFSIERLVGQIDDLYEELMG